jgi:hypothetical protein
VENCAREISSFESEESSRMRWVGHVALMGERRSVYRVLVGVPVGRRPFGRLRRRWDFNIKVDLQQAGCAAWTGLIWLRVGTGGWHL